jgi:hypothetical protein
MFHVAGEFMAFLAFDIIYPDLGLKEGIDLGSWFMSANRMGCAQAKAALSKKSGRLYSGKHLSVRKVRLQI